ncbi:hypothetical protein V2Z46_004291 [Salmonella enterica]|uniref:Uncharacterized protein n=2 Tax=Salmonella enterica TaxID=28901 RepID=A0A5V2JAQ7_SALER|nr:hypothetical protein [Salmonella enterica]ECY7798177.1 hypothetical protein [Salmonella enterica subsp. enterica serovar Itami]EDK0704923.1 hypothetical protein [Salmonella bongori]EDK3135719.1 hypothetical protein [Salmonella enterica subsp. enterica serovar Newport]EDT6425002.1 hypothetical protein [Salmonella enterica subsp. enterica]EDT8313361.1 hypothetical protein [Salmonella enterica subsp. enterica serovar Michigan]EDY1477999.1 hypothetical protein [Salmonella enterica subsp. enter
MRVLNAGVLICVAVLVCLTGYLSLRSIQSEGASLKTCALMSAPFLIWLAYQKARLFAEKITTERKPS